MYHVCLVNLESPWLLKAFWSCSSMQQHHPHHGTTTTLIFTLHVFTLGENPMKHFGWLRRACQTKCPASSNTIPSEYTSDFSVISPATFGGHSPTVCPSAPRPVAVKWRLKHGERRSARAGAGLTKDRGKNITARDSKYVAGATSLLWISKCGLI